tara:strand:- start:841 stop:1896 length:1056 start_codon:yes stop_codon:yes gene_type:complete
MDIFKDALKVFFIVSIFFNIVLYPMTSPFHDGYLAHLNKFTGFSEEVFHEEGLLKEKNEFMFSSFIGDAKSYSRMVMGEEVISPYKYRLLYPAIVKLFSNFWFGSTTSIPIQNTTIWLNFILVFLIFIISNSLFKKYTIRYSVWISLLIISLPAIFKTFPLLMLEIPSIVCILLLLSNLEKPLLLTLILVLSMLVKEVFVLSFFLVINQYLLRKRMVFLLISIIPIIMFLGTRYLFKDDLLSVNYGWNLSKGEFHMRYLNWAFASWKVSIKTFMKMAYVLSPLILYYLLPKNRNISEFINLNLGNFIFLFTVLISGVCLSAYHIRPWGILTPVTLYMIFNYRQELLSKFEN